MTSLIELHTTGGQSPWLDNLRRDWLRDGTLASWIERGVRGVTSNPSIFKAAIEGAAVYDEQFAQLIADGASVLEAYWELVIADISQALDLFAPVHEESGGVDGYVSLEVAPDLARDTEGTIASARDLHRRIDRSNLFVKIPGTAQGVPAIRTAISEGLDVNVTLLFSTKRYEEVIEAHLSGLEAADGPIDGVSSVASFFVSRVDAAVDAELETIGSPEALALRGKAAIANARLAYELFRERYSGERWEALAARGARVQRPLWASTSTKDPTYPQTLYVDTLIGPDTVNTMPEGTLEAFERDGRIARTVDADVDGARQVLDQLATLGIDLDEITDRLEHDGVVAFETAFDALIASLEQKAADLGTV